MQRRLPELHRSGLGLAAISYDSEAVLANFSRRRGITFPLLSDEGSAVIREYGILNTTVPASNRQEYGIPFPGTFIVDRDGIVTSRFFEAAYQERNTVDSLLVRLGRSVTVPATSVKAGHLAVTTYSTDQTVSPGTHFSIVLDVQPAKHVHVYAPGTAGYQPVGLTLEPMPGLILRDVQFPRSEDFYFKPLNEHVAVYHKPFRIVQDLIIDASPPGVRALRGLDHLTIAGTLAYQACDDRVCFAPQEVPLSWTLTLQPLDRERARQQ